MSEEDAPLHDTTLHRVVGVIEGKLGAVESRLERIETGLGARMDAMHVELRAIFAYQREREGSKAGLGNAGQWLLAVLVAAGAWVPNIFHWPKPGG